MPARSLSRPVAPFGYSRYDRSRKIDVSELILKTPAPKSPDTAAFKAPKKVRSTANVADHSHGKPPKFFIIGPLTPQALALSSTSEESGATDCSPSRPFRSASTSHLPDSPLGPGLGADSTVSSPVQPSRTFFPTSPSPERHMDWVKYSAPMAELENCGSFSDESSWSGDSRSAEGNYLDQIVIVNRNEPVRARQVVDPQVLAQLLSQCLIPSIPLVARTSRHSIRLASRSPCLPTIPSVSGPVSPPPTPPRDPSDLVRTPQDVFGPIEVIVKLPNMKETVQLNESLMECDACGREVNQLTLILPCEDLACSHCFSSSVSAVSVSYGPAKCPACMEQVATFEPLKGGRSTGRATKPPIKRLKPSVTIATRDSKQNDTHDSPFEVCPTFGSLRSAVMRIDNVAWDVTPEIVESFLPADTLAYDLLQPIHILLDRYDGRTKDYLYVELASIEAVRTILKTRQNAFMPGGPISGGRKRPVTVSLVEHAELLAELRPRSASELHSLLTLCQAAVSSPPLVNPALGHITSFVAPNGVAHFVKSRHGPFQALMSIMSKLKGKQSPAYWDVFQTASGAIAALANTNPHFTNSSSNPLFKTVVQQQDEQVLAKLSSMFAKCFNMKTMAG